jgi:hypothetical protein
MTYHLQFFRQWLGDIGVDDMKADGSLDDAKALARATLETLARERTSRFRPRTAFILDAQTRDVLVAYRLTDAGPVELPRGSRSPAKTVSAAAHSRVAEDRAGSDT